MGYHVPNHRRPESEPSWFSLTEANRGLASRLLIEAMALIETDLTAAKRCLEGVATLIAADDRSEKARNCMLADWQVRRAQTYILGNLGSPLRIGTIAELVGLSPSYFSRAFKMTTGQSYTDFVVEARIEAAKLRLLTADIPIAQIALDCGFADQSHLTRIFGKIVGAPPRAWRRSFVGRRSEFAHPFPEANGGDFASDGLPVDHTEERNSRARLVLENACVTLE